MPGTPAAIPLKVNPIGLRVEATQSEGRAAELSAVTPPLNPAASAWQSSAGRSNRYRSAASKALASGSARQRFVADGLTGAAEDFENNEAASADKLRAVSSPGR